MKFLKEVSVSHGKHDKLNMIFFSVLNAMDHLNKVRKFTVFTCTCNGADREDFLVHIPIKLPPLVRFSKSSYQAG